MDSRWVRVDIGKMLRNNSLGENNERIINERTNVVTDL